MYCKNCGKPMDDVAAVCVNCGAPKMAGNNFCPNCGAQTAPGAAFCLFCGVALNPQATASVNGAQKEKLLPDFWRFSLANSVFTTFILATTKEALSSCLF